MDGISGRTYNDNNDVEALLTELHEFIDRDAEPQLQVAICRRVLQIDSHTHVIPLPTRGMVLLANGNALQKLAYSAGGQEHVTLLRQAITCYDDALEIFHRETAPSTGPEHLLIRAMRFVK